MCIRLLVLTLAFAGTTACSKSSSSDSGSSSATEDSSASGAAASTVGGAISQSSGNGTIASNAPLLLRALTGPTAIAAVNACPTLKSTASTGANSCASTSNVATLTYSSCSFGAAAATWNGILAVSFTGATTLSCGTFPAPTADTMLRQFVTAGGAKLYAPTGGELGLSEHPSAGGSRQNSHTRTAEAQHARLFGLTLVMPPITIESDTRRRFRSVPCAAATARRGGTCGAECELRSRRRRLADWFA